MRIVFTAGVLDVLLERDAPPFDWIVGVSAGAACATSYLARQPGRRAGPAESRPGAACPLGAGTGGRE